MSAYTDHNAAEHAFAAQHGFYRRQLWWIDTFTIRHGQYYTYATTGRNGMRGDEVTHWAVPSLDNSAYAFALREVY